MKHTRDELKILQNLPYEIKVKKTKQRIREWYEHWSGQVYVSISGKDSTALLYLVRSIYPDVIAVFVDTGLEYPEVKQLAKSHDNVVILHPKMAFWEVIKNMVIQ